MHSKLYNSYLLDVRLAVMSAARILLQRTLGSISITLNKSYQSVSQHCYCNKPALTSQLTTDSCDDNAADKSVLVFEPAKPSDLVDVDRHLSPTFNFAAYINKSKSLQELVKLGVDLSKIEKKRDVVPYVLQLNFTKDVKPYIQFLHDKGVPADALGEFFTKNILICRESLDDLQTRINYLESKKFNKDMIASIIKRNPLWLTTPVSVIDDRLGWLQSSFQLSGDDVRQIVNALPQIVTFNINTIKLNMFVFEEEMGMPKGMIKDMLKKRPRLFIKNQRKLLSAFEFVHNVMRVPIDRICVQPDILMERIHIIKERHYFLESLGRAQYNPQLPGYISLDSFIKSSDLEFCTEIAKSSVQSYNLFLKTL